MKVKVKMKVLSFLLCTALIGNIFPINSIAAEKDVYALTYHVGAYDMFPESDGSISVMIDGKKYYYSDDFDDGKIATKLSKMENQNVVYELHNNKIVKVYTMDEVLEQEVTVEPSVKDGLIYRKGKFSQKSFELVVKVSNNLQGDFQKNDLLWFLSDTEKGCLYSTLKKLEIEPSNKVDFGSSGWWMWKEYEKTISENVNDVIKAEETKEYKYTVNLHNEGVVNQKEYNIILYATPTFDTGVGCRIEGKIPVGNLDYQEEKVEEKKATSNSGQSVAQAATKLDGIQNAIQFSKDLFSADQMNQINEFVNIWMSELLLAKYVDKSDLKEKVSEKIANELLKKLGLDTSVIAIPGEIRATTHLETKTKDGTKAFIQFNINLLNFDFGNSGMPTMATGSGTAVIYNMNGEELDSSVILPAYANICAFCEQLQNVAKDTIFNGAKEYLGLFGISAEATAEALSSQIMAKVLNNKYAKDAFKMVDAKDVKIALKKIITNSEKIVNKKIFKLITTPSQGSTEVSVKCPVDVKIYDNDGKLCGEVKNNVVNSTYVDIFVTVVGEQKNIYLIGDEYSFEMTGTDDGSMDYVVREFEEDGVVTREIAYENVKLSEGCKYYSYVPETINHSSTLFDLTDSEGNVISPTKGADVDSDIDNIGGKCGENVYWELSDDGILRIYGNGNMYDYGIYNCSPWDIYRKEIVNVSISDGINHIGGYAFSYCSNLNKIEIPDTVISIGKDCFEYCSKLESIKLPDSIELLGLGAFEYCSMLKKIEIPKKIRIIQQYTFMGCKQLSDIFIPEGVTFIDSNAFAGCAKLESINIPASTKYRSDLTFMGSSFKTINVDENNPYMLSDKGVLFLRSGALNLPYMSEKTLLKYPTMKTDVSYVIPSDTKNIAPCAFYGTNFLQSVEMGEFVTHISSYAFNGCSSMKNVKILNETCNIEDSLFTFDKNITIYGYTNSTAETYAKKYERNFISLGTKVSVDGTTTSTSNETPPDKTPEIQEKKGSAIANNKITKIKKVKRAKKSLKVSWKKVKGVSGYQIQYSTSRKFKKAKKITIRKTKITSKTIKRLKAKKKYYVRIRTYIVVNEKKYYSDWSKTKVKQTN